jgi:uncharacterized membrane protein YphA (DoxX/SURF4 family)
MKSASLSILRVGIGITFLWIGILIFRNPTGWGSLLLPWAIGLLPGSLETVMIQTAIIDVAIGLLLLMNLWPWIAAFLASFHLLIVLITVGITEITARDIGLLAGSIALLLESTLPSFLPTWLPGKR